MKKELLSIIHHKEPRDNEFLIVMWEESGGHTLNILDYSDLIEIYINSIQSGQSYRFLGSYDEVIEKGYTFQNDPSLYVGTNKTISYGSDGAMEV